MVHGADSRAVVVGYDDGDGDDGYDDVVDDLLACSEISCNGNRGYNGVAVPDSPAVGAMKTTSSGAFYDRCRGAVGVASFQQHWVRPGNGCILRRCISFHLNCDAFVAVEVQLPT